MMHMQLAVTPMPSLSAASPASVAALRDAVVSETRLLGELLAIMRRQREAVGRDDLATVDDSVFATQRVLHTLNEARRRRHTVYRLLGVPEDGGPRAVAAVLGPAMTPELREALDHLIGAARVLSAEVEMNRRVLRQALAAGDDFVRALSGAPQRLAYGAGAAPPAPAPARGGALLDRQG
jgi:hypothetical protein